MCIRATIATLAGSDRKKPKKDTEDMKKHTFQNDD
jgi:hypothetical protein